MSENVKQVKTKLKVIKQFRRIERYLKIKAKLKNDKN